MANGKRLIDDLFSQEGAICPSPEETLRLGEEIGAELRAGSVVSLEGPLGAGKTQLVKGLARGLGCEVEASSPSFALVHEYEGGRAPLHHFDWYRLENAGELVTAGFEDSLGDAATVIEWGDKFSEALPPGTLRLRLRILPGGSRCIKGAWSGGRR